MKKYKIHWCTDIHLDHLLPGDLKAFLQQIHDLDTDGIAITGDISNGKRLESHLEMIDEAAQVPVYFVLGNHDSYGGSIAESVAIASRVAADSRHLKYFDERHRVFEIGPSTAVIGHNGWADARMGSFLTSRVNLNDYTMIQELAKFEGWKILLQDALAKLGDESAEFIERSLDISLPAFDNLLVLTHVPPFRDACVYNGKVSDNDWLPHFSSLAFGQVLERRMAVHPDKKMTVLCGHTHGGGMVDVASNIRVYTGESEYGDPMIQSFVYEAM